MDNSSFAYLLSTPNSRVKIIVTQGVYALASVALLFADLFGAGIPIAFILMNMLGGASASVEILKKLSIYGFYDPVELVHGGDIWGVNLVYIGIIAVLFVTSVLIFKKKRLPL